MYKTNQNFGQSSDSSKGRISFNLPEAKEIRQQQRHILLAAIDRYLQWREDKSKPDGRSYNVTILTYLHHLTSFGELRANTLKRHLAREVISDPLQILQDHFRKDPRLNNHSLDTFLLESIFHNKKLFLVPNDFSYLDPIETRISLRDLILNQNSYSNEEYAYHIGRLYEEDALTPNHLEKACFYYAISVKHDHRHAKRNLIALAKAGCSEAQYLLGIYYYHHRNNFQEAIKWCLQAAEQQHQEAQTYLHETVFSADIYLYLAKRYEYGDGTSQNMVCALKFYEKAVVLNNSEAAMRLGKFYKPPLENSKRKSGITVSSNTNASRIFTTNINKSFNFYLVAAKQGIREALTCMVDIAEYSNEDTLRFTIGEIYIEAFQDPENGLRYFKQLAEKKLQRAIAKINGLTHQNAEYAYLMGKLYEKDSDKGSNITDALKYYKLALNKNHPHAIDTIRNIAVSNNSEAQYILGFEYYHRRQQVTEAIKWCICATEQAHQMASDYIFKTDFTAEQYLMIAKIYDKGENVKSNFERALYFCGKAFEKGNVSAAMYLGQWYNPTINVVMGENTSYQNNLQKAFGYYEFAAKRNEHSALNAIVSLLKHYDNEELQFRLAKLYIENFNKPKKALRYFKKLADKNFKPAINQLNNVTASNAEYASYVAKSYMNEENRGNNVQIAAYYYLLALQNNSEAYSAFLIEIIEAATTTDDLYAIALMCFSGKDKVKRNFKIAKQCFEVIIERVKEGHKVSFSGEIYFYLGILFQDGLGVNVDPVTAVKYFHMSNHEGYIEAAKQLQTLLCSHRLNIQQLKAIAAFYLNEPNQKDLHWPYILTCYEEASKRGDSVAIRWLAEFYQLEHKGIPKDNCKAFQYYLRLAEMQDIDAFPPLERLAHEVSAKQQYMLSQLYTKFFYTERAEYWREQAEEINQLTLNL